MGELRRGVLEVHHVKVGPHPTSSPLTHTYVHLSPWLMYLDKDWSNAGGGEEKGEERKRERRKKGREGEEEGGGKEKKERRRNGEEEKWGGGDKRERKGRGEGGEREGEGGEGGETRKRERVENTCGSFTCCIKSKIMMALPSCIGHSDCH